MIAEIDGRVAPLLVSALQTFSLVNIISKTHIVLIRDWAYLHLTAVVGMYLNSHTNTKLEPGKNLHFRVT